MTIQSQETVEKAKTETPVVTEEVTTVETAPEPAPVVTEATPAVTTEEVPAPAPVAGVGVTEKKEIIDGAEEVAKATEEAGVDSSLNKTDSQVEVIKTETTEEVPATTETVTTVEVPATTTEEVTTEVAKTETEAKTTEVGGEATPVAPKTEDVLAMANAFTTKAIADALQPLTTLIAGIQKSFDEQAGLTKTKDETHTKNTELLTKTITSMGEIVSSMKSKMDNMNASIAFRKSSAYVVAEKGSSSNEADLTDPNEFNKAVLAEMDANGGAYAKARDTVMAKLNSTNN
jgi:hypothetical protein